jgi:glycosyltransferase involved in cell wall biosynthesis
VSQALDAAVKAPADLDTIPRDTRAVVAWQMLTGEYPPQPGGVSDYTRLMARGLADAGDRVDVFAPPCKQPGVPDPGVTVHRLPDHFGLRSLRILSRHLSATPAPRRLLVQYVPHAFGWKALNIPFCLWLLSRRRDSVWVIFHEVAFPIQREQALRWNVLGLGTRLMAAIVSRAADRAFVSTLSWRPLVTSLVRGGTPVSWLPVPSSIAVVSDPRGIFEVRARYSRGHGLVGHFGTYGRAIRMQLDRALPILVTSADCRVLLMGRGSAEMRSDLVARHAVLLERIHATGDLTPDQVSCHVGACDVMLQPYPDGISTRRTSAMVALSHRRPLVTTSGHLTEPLWAASEAVVMVPVGDDAGLAKATADLLDHPVRLEQLGAAAVALYDRWFETRHSIAVLRAPAGTA